MASRSPTPSGSPPPTSSSPETPSIEEDINLAQGVRVHSSREGVFVKYTPFAIALAAGNLSVGSFCHFISQGKNFLKAYSEAYESAADDMDMDEEQYSLAVFEVRELRKIVLREIKKHDSFLQEWGLDITKDATPLPAMENCAEFLLAAASGIVDGAIYTIDALTPCVQLYPFLAAEVQMLPGFREYSHHYRKWIEMYTSDSHQELAVKTEKLQEKLSVTLTGDEIDILYNLYHQTMILEIDFFNSLPFDQPTVVPVTKGLSSAEDRLMVLSDFDLACTVHDSSAILAYMAQVTAAKSDHSPSGSECSPSESPLARRSSGDVRNMWEEICKQYAQEYEACIERIIPAEKVEFNHSSLVQVLEQLADFERRANFRVIESGVLRGLKLDEIIKAGENLTLQDGCISFYQKLAEINVDANIRMLSYCWCGVLIRSSLSSVGFDESNVHANELIFNEEYLCTGEKVRKVESPIEKLQIYNHILKKDADKRNKLTVYVGYCIRDILCLLEADIGIVIGSSKRLRRAGSRLGLTFAPLFAAAVRKQEEVTDGGLCELEGNNGLVLGRDTSFLAGVVGHYCFTEHKQTLEDRTHMYIVEYSKSDKKMVV